MIAKFQETNTNRTVTREVPVTFIMGDILSNNSSLSAAAKDALNFYQTAAQQQPNPSQTNAYKEEDSLAFEMSRVSMRTQRPLKILCCGAGISGLNLAHEVGNGKFGNAELIIYEKNSDIGGTWFENRYPGSDLPLRAH